MKFFFKAIKFQIKLFPMTFLITFQVSQQSIYNQHKVIQERDYAEPVTPYSFSRVSNIGIYKYNIYLTLFCFNVPGNINIKAFLTYIFSLFNNLYPSYPRVKNKNSPKNWLKKTKNKKPCTFTQVSSPSLSYFFFSLVVLLLEKYFL